MNSFFKLGFIILSFIGIGVGTSYLTENYNILPIKQSDVSTLINTLWQVHAGLATTSIAILALLTGLNKEKKYGFKTLDFMLNINRKKMQLKFHEEISISILLLFLQYGFVAANKLAGLSFYSRLQCTSLLEFYTAVLK